MVSYLEKVRSSSKGKTKGTKKGSLVSPQNLERVGFKQRLAVTRVKPEQKGLNEGCPFLLGQAQS